MVLLKYKTEILVLIFECSLHDTPKDWAFQVHMYAYAHNSQPLSELNVSPHEIVFHTRPRIPLKFDLNLNREYFQNMYFTLLLSTP